MALKYLDERESQNGASAQSIHHLSNVMVIYYCITIQTLSPQNSNHFLQLMVVWVSNLAANLGPMWYDWHHLRCSSWHLSMEA